MRKNILIYLSLILSIISLVLIFSIIFKIYSGYYTFGFEYDANYTMTITIIVAVLVGFSVISIYSIFNTNVDSYKEQIEKIILDVQELEGKLKEEQAKTGKEYALISDVEVINNTFNDYIKLFSLISPYTNDTIRLLSIKYFEVNKPNDEIKLILEKFYKDIENGASSKKIRKSLSNLLNSWQ